MKRGFPDGASYSSYAGIVEEWMHFEVYVDLFQQYRWRLIDDNGSEVAVSPDGYYNKLACQRCVALVRAAATNAELRDLVLNAKP